MNDDTKEVNHPDHYNWLPGTECIDVVEHFNYNLGCVIKYVWRAGRKANTDKMTDLRKAKWYISRELDRLHREARDAEPTDEEMLEYERQLKEQEDAELDIRYSVLVPTDEVAAAIVEKMYIELDGTHFCHNNTKGTGVWVRRIVSAFTDTEAAQYIAHWGTTEGGGADPDMNRCLRKAMIIRRLWGEMGNDTEQEPIETEKEQVIPMPTDAQAITMVREMLVKLDGKEIAASRFSDEAEWGDWTRSVVAARDVHEAASFIVDRITYGGGESHPDIARCYRMAHIIRYMWARRHGTDTTENNGDTAAFESLWNDVLALRDDINSRIMNCAPDGGHLWYVQEQIDSILARNHRGGNGTDTTGD